MKSGLPRCVRALRASVAVLDRHAEAFAKRREFFMQGIDILADVGQQLRRIFELAVAVAAIVSQVIAHRGFGRSEEHTSELQSLMRISYAVFCLNKKKSVSDISFI